MTNQLPALRQSAVDAATHTTERIDPETLYPIYYEIPPGCGVTEVPDERMWPLFSIGDCVVVDHMDRDFVEGEIFLLLTGSPKLWQVRQWRNRNGHQLQSDELCIRMDPINRPGNLNDIYARSRQGRPIYNSDGPLKSSAWPAYCLGRVVGRYLDRMRIPSHCRP